MHVQKRVLTKMALVSPLESSAVQPVVELSSDPERLKYSLKPLISFTPLLELGEKGRQLL